MNGPASTTTQAFALVERQFDDDWRKVHIKALADLLSADRPLTYADLADQRALSLRQTKRIVRDLERRGLVDRYSHPRGSTAPDRFEATPADHLTADDTT